MLTAALGLSGALIFGSADFLGGLAAQRISAILATALSAAGGLLLLLIALPLTGGAWSPAAVLWAGLSGITGALAISLLYACLAIGPMSILSPLTAVVSAIVPMTVGLIGGDRFAPIGYGALGLALIAVVLVGFVPEKGAVRPTPRAILMATTSGAMIGTFIILIDQTPTDSGVVPLVINRVVTATIMFSVVGIRALVTARTRAHRRESVSWGASGAKNARTDAPTELAAHAELDRRNRSLGLRLALACGAVDATANILLLLGIRSGDLSVMSVLIALYPAGTILLAAVVLRERIAPVQWLGLVLALVAAGGLALAS
ncbi:EamA family transporter [Glaciibacter psychrotolerans]|uniref:Drug/metabolite transporter (DMT)-like permease n=1 Tax=Glaciibacter psychrotolerans TaxID=670054 RepID=A0A7Z0EIB7_9MICO|nr:EamA family transporter [Leifsonia psychrotolerans]NYJ21392.1 drug/metabolite transporter (DMT)-like permease [Leifsonia psychrotolerans]